MVCGMCYPVLWDCAYKRALAANRKEYPVLWKRVSLSLFPPAVGWSRYRNANPVPTIPLGDDITTAPSGLVIRQGCLSKEGASDIWLRTILIVRKETRCRHIGYSYRLTARVLLYAPSHRQDNTYHGLYYTSRGALAGTRNSSMGSPHEGSIRRPTAP